jgi:hypothetical protein
VQAGGLCAVEESHIACSPLHLVGDAGYAPSFKCILALAVEVRMQEA